VRLEKLEHRRTEPSYGYILNMRRPLFADPVSLLYRLKLRGPTRALVPDGALAALVESRFASDA
jgi:hypothetical protein